jgi:hypothetical protein
MVTVYDTKSNRYGGLLDHITAQVIAVISREYSVTFTAALKTIGPGLKKCAQNRQHALRIIIYRLRGDGEAIGKLLSEKKLYLQQPDLFDSSIVYLNPHYLLRPGSELKPSSREDADGSSRNYKMTAIAKSQVLQVFDTASGPVSFCEVQVSSRLVEVLKS